jgi:hypothetical protein
MQTEGTRTLSRSRTQAHTNDLPCATYRLHLRQPLRKNVDGAAQLLHRCDQSNHQRAVVNRAQRCAGGAAATPSNGPDRWVCAVPTTLQSAREGGAGMHGSGIVGARGGSAGRGHPPCCVNSVCVYTGSSRSRHAIDILGVAPPPIPCALSHRTRIVKQSTRNALVGCAVACIARCVALSTLAAMGTRSRFGN